MTTTVRGAARSVGRSPVLQGLARGGYAADGVVHLLIGVFVVGVATGSPGGTADQSGALEAIAGQPFGVVALWLVAALLAALAVYHAVAAFLVRADSVPKTWGRRLSEAGQAVVFGALGALAASVALGARPQGDQSAQDASAGVLSVPGGAAVLFVVGAAIAVGGVVFAGMGVARSFRKRVRIPAGSMGRVVVGLGVVGYVAKGIALATVGVLAVVAATSGDAGRAGGLDEAIDALLALPYGPFVVAAVGIGLIAYGLFLVLRARYAKLRAAATWPRRTAPSTPCAAPRRGSG